MTPGRTSAPELLERAHDRMGSYRERLELLVSTDSGSGDADGVRAVAALVAGWLREAGAEVSLVPACHPDGRDLGDLVLARVPGDGRARVLLCGHLDTVFPAGEASRRPYAERDGIATGPGVSDDKGGLLTGLLALECLLEDDARPWAEVLLVLTPDEEIGSPGSVTMLQRVATGFDVALCLECAREDGSVVHGRKGVADVVVRVRGRAAHAGIEPERGASAALAAAHLIVAVQALNGRWPDVTLNVGVVRSGRRANVVPADAEVVVDLRAEDPAHFDEALAALADLVADLAVPGTSAQLEVRDPAVPWLTRGPDRELGELYRRSARDLGLQVRATSTGGSADANHLATVVPAVLDGLGPVGGDDHAVSEWLDLATVAPRGAALAALVLALAT